MDDSFLYDVRVRDRLLKKGLLKAEVLQKHLDALTDVESEAETLPLEQPAMTPRGESGR